MTDSFTWKGHVAWSRRFLLRSETNRDAPRGETGAEEPRRAPGDVNRDTSICALDEETRKGNVGESDELAGNPRPFCGLQDA